ncbi:sulfotransferase family cytosolic 1B member 1-like [Patiria miniata]|uniref:Sulfotransferase domain-containing protein n=1 Tax=Patiria miniata TaxID=46514 RepID=A0A914A7X6_PATMI|nr:sulfotransferase family cytosolic 1B member 1-like [Patiria miniata]
MTESNVRKWEHVLRGQPLPYRVLDANLQGVLDMEVRENDVFVVSYPKAGTNWLRAIINCMLKCPEDQNNMSLPLEMSMSSGTSQQEIEAAPPVFKIVQSWTSPRVMFTHLMPHLLPSHLSERGAKVVYICRNPKDVSVSYYYFRKTLRSKVQAPSLDVYIQQFMQGEVVYGSYFTHVKQYWEMKDKSNLLFIKYEDLKKDENAVIGEIATFLGRDLDADEIANISRQCSVPSMRTTFKTASQAVSVIMDQSKGEFVRKGKVGSWKETLTEAQSQRFDTLLSDHLAGTGLTFDFE